MKLRSFLYLNTKVLDEYIAAIDGGLYDEESRTTVAAKENSVTGKGTMVFFLEMVSIFQKTQRK